ARFPAPPRVPRDAGRVHGLLAPDGAGSGDPGCALDRPDGTEPVGHRDVLPRRTDGDELSQAVLAAHGGEPLPPLLRAGRRPHPCPPPLRDPRLAARAGLAHRADLPGRGAGDRQPVGGALPRGIVRLGAPRRMGAAHVRDRRHRRSLADCDVGSTAVVRLHGVARARRGPRRMKTLWTAALLAVAAPALADQLFLRESEAPRALFGEHVTSTRKTLELSPPEVAELSRVLERKVEIRSYPYLEIRPETDGDRILGEIFLLDVIGQSQPITFAVGV